METVNSTDIFCFSKVHPSMHVNFLFFHSSFYFLFIFQVNLHLANIELRQMSIRHRDAENGH